MSDIDPECNAYRAQLISSLFESEVLVWLMLRNWNHPLADDKRFHSALLETATEVLVEAAASGCEQVFVQGMPARDMNLISALWYAESCALEDRDSYTNQSEKEERLEWLDSVKHSLPSCFCPLDALPDEN